MNNNFGILKFVKNKKEEKIEGLINFANEQKILLYLVGENIGENLGSNIKTLDYDNLFQGVINRYIKELFEQGLTHVIIIKEGVVFKQDKIKGLISSFNKYPRLGISYCRVLEKSIFLNSYFSICNFENSKKLASKTNILSFDNDTFSPIFNDFCFCISKKCYESIGEFSEELTTDYYKLDYSIRVTEEKFRMICLKDSEVETTKDVIINWLNIKGYDVEKDKERLMEQYGSNLEKYNNIQLKTAVQCPIYNQEHLIEPWLNNVTQYADEIIILYSDAPWKHNPAAKNMFYMDKSKELLDKYKNILGDKLHLIEGYWNSETDERNQALIKAKELGAKWLLICDCDEFYEKQEMFKALDFMTNNETEIFVMNCIQLVKKVNWAAFPKEGYPLANFAINLDTNIKFLSARVVGGAAILIPADICKCYHLSYLLPKEKLEQKLLTSAHFVEFLEGWYEEVWPKINLDSINFHPTHPEAWSYMKNIMVPESITNGIEYLSNKEFH